MKIQAEIPSYKKININVPDGARPSEIKKMICGAFGVEPSLSRVRNEDGTYIVDYYWARQLLLYGRSALAKLRGATVIQVGAGAIGNEVGKNLALSGVGRLVIVDMDDVEFSNLSRGMLFGRGDLGKPKAEVLSRGLATISPVKAQAFTCKAEELDPKLWLEADLIVSALDNMVARLFLAETSIKYRTPLIDGGVRETGVRVQVMRRPSDPCLACLIPKQHWASALNLRNACDDFVEEKMPSSVQPMALAGAIMAEESLKLLTKSGKPLAGVLMADMALNRYSTLPLIKNPDCQLCGSKSDLRPYRRFRGTELSELQAKYDTVSRVAVNGSKLLALVSRKGFYEQVILETKAAAVGKPGSAAQ